MLLAGCRRADEPYAAARQAAALDAELDWSRARLLAVQDGGRYKTLDSFAREWLHMMTRQDHLPGLSPCASLLEWLFNRDAYADAPLIRLRDPGLAARLATGLPEDKRQRILATKCFTPRELDDPAVARVLLQMEGDVRLQRAVNRVRTAQAIAARMPEFIAVVPQPGGGPTDPWFTPSAVLANVPAELLAAANLSAADLPREAQTPIPNLSPQEAQTVALTWAALRAGWLAGDAAKVQAALDRLTTLLPALAGADAYPSHAQRAAEARYYAAGKFTGGWIIYFLGLIVSVVALVTHWRTPWVVALVLCLAALAFHAYGLALRWYILGRIPVANDFESIVAAAWMGIAVAVLLEVWLRSRVLLVAAQATGFVGLVTAQFMPTGGDLTTVPGILDDVQLRLHTVMVIAAYAFIFVAAVIAVIYLVGYIFVRLSDRAAEPAAVPAGAVSRERPLLAGATPGDEAWARLPQWLNNIDWVHLIILNIAFVLLFLGGLVLGAVWADYSWGRPWGWDAKEVFALNTWIIYAILLHMRFVVRNRGLWTAILSLVGCAMMAINWFAVNFLLESIHSYV